MNEIVNKFLLTGDKYMPEMHLRQPRFTYCACEPFVNINNIVFSFQVYRKCYVASQWWGFNIYVQAE